MFNDSQCNMVLCGNSSQLYETYKVVKKCWSVNSVKGFWQIYDQHIRMANIEE